MPRYLVERTFPDGLSIPVGEQAAEACRTMIGNSAQDGLTWVHSYVTGDGKRMFCIYDAPAPETIRRAAQPLSLLGEPVDQRLGKVALGRLQHGGLTRRQLEILRLVALGYTDPQIAQ